MGGRPEAALASVEMVSPRAGVPSRPVRRARPARGGRGGAGRRCRATTPGRRRSGSGRARSSTRPNGGRQCPPATPEAAGWFATAAAEYGRVQRRPLAGAASGGVAERSPAVKRPLECNAEQWQGGRRRVGPAGPGRIRRRTAAGGTPRRCCRRSGLRRSRRSGPARQAYRVASRRLGARPLLRGLSCSPSGPGSTWSVRPTRTSIGRVPRTLGLTTREGGRRSTC